MLHETKTETTRIDRDGYRETVLETKTIRQTSSFLRDLTVAILSLWTAMYLIGSLWTSGQPQQPARSLQESR